MKKVELYAGRELSDALLTLKIEAKTSGEECFAEFNGKEIYSTDTLDEAYIRVLECSYEEHLIKIKEWREHRKKKEQEFKKKIPELIEKYRSEARGIIAEDMLKYWDEIVPVRLRDLYHGWELSCTLDIIKIMNNKKENKESRIEKAKEAFLKQDHSGMSVGLMFAMLRTFSPDSIELVKALKE